MRFPHHQPSVTRALLRLIRLQTAFSWLDGYGVFVGWLEGLCWDSSLLVYLFISFCFAFLFSPVAAVGKVPDYHLLAVEVGSGF